MHCASHCSGLPILVLLAWAAGEAPALARECGDGSVSQGVVRAVLDGRTLALADGRIVRLAGINVPGSLKDNADPAKPEAKARVYLEAQLVGRTVAFATQSAAIDRYERIRAYVFLKSEDLRAAGLGTAELGAAGLRADSLGTDGLEASVQQGMLALGLARVAGSVGGRACAAALWAREQVARVAGLGLWADSAYAVRSAEDPAAVLRLRGALALVEGKVVSVRESGGTIYVNFGRRWSEDFTVTVPKRSERAFAAAGMNVRQLERRTVRVRGWVEERGGPWIDVRLPEQIEVVRD